MSQENGNYRQFCSIQFRPDATQQDAAPRVLPPLGGPLRNWSEVPGQFGMFVATGGEVTNQSFLIAVEPDNVWIQPLPKSGKQVLPVTNDPDVPPPLPFEEEGEGMLKFEQYAHIF